MDSKQVVAPSTDSDTSESDERRGGIFRVAKRKMLRPIKDKMLRPSYDKGE